jgi:hypothetical protein
MSEETEEGAEGEVSLDIPEDHDWFLSQLVTWARLGIEMPITLSVKGQLVSGILVAQKRYMEEMRSLNAAGLKDSPGIGAAIDETFQVVIDAIPEVGEGDEKLPPPIYLHLQDARYYAGDNPLPSTTGLWWRGKISSVDGFSIGQIKPESK